MLREKMRKEKKKKEYDNNEKKISKNVYHLYQDEDQ
jgi:hypothetical protein